MTYNELKQICEIKNISLVDLCSRAEITRQGLQKIMNKGSLEIQLAKKLADILCISIMAFIVDNPFTALNANTKVNKSEIDLLREIIKSKDEIIKMQSEKIQSFESPNLMVAGVKEIYKKK